MDYLELIPSTVAGYWIFKKATHPNSNLRKKLPNIIFKKRLQIMPVFRLRIFGRVIHLHHWVNLSILLGLSFFLTGGILAYMITKGILLGGIIQGLRLPKGHRSPIYKDFSLKRLTNLPEK